MNEEMLLTNIYVRSRVFSGLIHSACGLSCWCFSVTGEKLFFSTCPDEQEFLLFLRSSGCLDYATGEQVRRDRPVILSDSIGIIWGAEYHVEKRCAGRADYDWPHLQQQQLLPQH